MDDKLYPKPCGHDHSKGTEWASILSGVVLVAMILIALTSLGMLSMETNFQTPFANQPNGSNGVVNSTVEYELFATYTGDSDDRGTLSPLGYVNLRQYDAHYSSILIAWSVSVDEINVSVVFKGTIWKGEGNGEQLFSVNHDGLAFYLESTANFFYEVYMYKQIIVNQQ